MWGGPGVVPGTVDILSYVSPFFPFISRLTLFNVCSADTGSTLEGKQTFTAFLGPMHRVLQEKFRQWIQLTYSMYDSDQVLRYVSNILDSS